MRDHSKYDLKSRGFPSPDQPSSTSSEMLEREEAIAGPPGVEQELWGAALAWHLR